MTVVLINPCCHVVLVKSGNSFTLLILNLYLHFLLANYNKQLNPLLTTGIDASLTSA